MDNITRGDYRDVEGNQLDSPGTAAYFPGTVVFGTRSQAASWANDTPGAVTSYPRPEIPIPSRGGEARQERGVGYSDGFLAVFRPSAFRGRTLAIPAVTANPKTGHIGLLTRSMRGKLDALTTDYTPSGNAVASDYLNVSG